jgi:hypothetical protein
LNTPLSIAIPIRSLQPFAHSASPFAQIYSLTFPTATNHPPSGFLSCLFCSAAADSSAPVRFLQLSLARGHRIVAQLVILHFVAFYMATTLRGDCQQGFLQTFVTPFTNEAKDLQIPHIESCDAIV